MSISIVTDRTDGPIGDWTAESSRRGGRARGGVYYSGFHVHLEVGFSTLSSAYFLCGHDSKQCDCAREEEAHMRTRTNPYQPFTAGKSAVLLGAGAGHVVYALSPSGLSNFCCS